MTANEKKLFASRPKTVKAMFQKLRKVGIDTEFLGLSTAMNSHDAPLGAKTNWGDPQSLPAFAGRLTCKPVKGFDYDKRGKPWDNLWWLHSGTGGGDAKGNWQGSFTIWCANVPEVTAEWEAARKESLDANERAREFNEKIGLEMHEAANRARSDVMKRHDQAWRMFRAAADKAEDAFKAWKKQNLVEKPK